jgi:hypothetical protein
MNLENLSGNHVEVNTGEHVEGNVCPARLPEEQNRSGMALAAPLED